MSKYNIFPSTLLRVLILIVGITTPGSAVLAATGYGVIAFSPSTQGNGYVFGFVDRGLATRTAIKECEKYSQSDDCISVVTFQSGCAALAAGGSAYGSASAADLDTARTAAIRSCQMAGGGEDCVVLRWLCH